ncbi:DUF1552 domain-containing protein [Woeseia oceani]|uniref:DUF1552 domain-containing protein n=1 Tax=Woeseia oceani TaxID=1548547 RepID=A0A193LCG1_9GAMM|nr:DUF1552 domain-containing protein [Woeseia oceani]ANO50084.1 hypothetical protein BA177_01590 [Woeseia oceani]
MKKLSRRRVLRGMVNGSAVSIALPLLNCFLNENGTALASGAPMPVRFGTWGYGLGMTANVFVPKKTGPDYDLPEEIASWASVKQHINLFTNATAFPDDAPNPCHYTGWVIGRTGVAPMDGKTIPGETIDVTIANQIGRTTRFRSLTATANADVRTTYSFENSTTPNSPEWSPLQFYNRLFGPEFPDPNATTFNPDPQVRVRKSVLSGVMDQTRSLMRNVGAEDRQRLDQYFSGLRQLENQFAQRLEKPEPIAGCRPGEAPISDPPMDKTAESVALRHRMMTDLMVMALACDQTRVFNMAYSSAASAIIKPGYEKPHHTTTHEEPIDAQLGYQPNASWFTRRAMESWAEFVSAFTTVKEGDGTLLDNVLIYATTDHGYARMHSMDGMPVFTAGRAGGKVKTGIHVDLEGGAGTRVGYTALRLMGVDTPSWGTKSNRTSAEVGEILA